MTDLDARHSEHLRVAMSLAYESLKATASDIIWPYHIVFKALELAVRTSESGPGHAPQWLKTVWPDFKSIGPKVQDVSPEIALWATMGLLLMDADLEEKVKAPGGAVERMQCVFDIYRENLEGEYTKRDWKLLCLLAMGKRRRDVAKALGMSPAAVSKRKEKHMLHLAIVLADYIPLEYYLTHDANPAPVSLGKKREYVFRSSESVSVG